MKRGKPLTRRARLQRAAIRKRTHAIAARTKGQWYSELRHVVATREVGRCARCGGVGAECHHRLLRSRGGTDDAWNCVWLCSDCHHNRIHAHPADATGRGWIVPTHADPRRWPVYRNGAWQQPTPDGWVNTEPQEGQAA